MQSQNKVQTSCELHKIFEDSLSNDSSESNNHYKLSKDYKMKLKPLCTQLIPEKEEEGCLTPHTRLNNVTEEIFWEIRNQRKSIKQKLRDISTKSSQASQITRQSTMRNPSDKFFSSAEIKYN